MDNSRFAVKGRKELVQDIGGDVGLLGFRLFRDRRY